MSHRTSADSGGTHGKYADEKSLDSGVLDSGFLSGVLDSASNLSECEEEPSGASAAVSRHALPELRETEYEYDEKIATEQSYFDSGLILESDSGLCHETTPSAAAAEEEACKGDEQQLLTLLEDAFAPDEDGETTFHSAIAQGFIEVVFSLVRLAPSSKYLNVRNGSYLTPLHVAVLGAQPWAIRRLLIAGCNLTARDRSGNTALHLACKSGDLASVRCLMQPITSHEASVCPKPQPNDLPRIPQDLELRNDDGLTCIHVAARAGHFHVVRLLLIYGANVNVEDGTSGRTALHLCAEAGMTQMCQYLIRCGADPDIDSWDGHTPADFALIAGNPTLADELCRLGSSLSPPDESDDEDDDDDESDADEGVLESEPAAFADG